MGIFGFNFQKGKTPDKLHTETGSYWWYEIWNNITNKETQRWKDEACMINAVMNNPAAMRVWKINCDLFSLGKVNKYQEDVEIEKDVLYSIKKRPNFHQSWTKFWWEYMFWLQFGTAYLYRDRDQMNDQTTLLWLNPSKIKWTDKLYSQFIFSQKSFNDQLKGRVKYTTDSGEVISIELKDITPFFDMSNGINGNRFKGDSDLHSLYKVIKNSELALDSKGINLEFSQKFIVSGQTDTDNPMRLGMSETEKVDVEQKLRGSRKIHAMKTKIDISRFVESMAALKLDDSFFSDYFTIGAMKGVPRDVLEVNLAKGSTYENQEKSIGRHVEYGMKPKGQMITDEFEFLFGFQDLRFSWSHLSFNQVFEFDRAERQSIQLANLEVAVRLGLDEKEAKRQLTLITTM